jgi:hypothetical protein
MRAAYDETNGTAGDVLRVGDIRSGERDVV